MGETEDELEEMEGACLVVYTKNIYTKKKQQQINTECNIRHTVDVGRKQHTNRQTLQPYKDYV